jgi:site-specific DNA-methyltransferase (adenine-specific)
MDLPINQVIQGDCLEVLKTFPDKSVDLVLTDPPYNVGFDYGEKHDDNKGDYSNWCASWLAELERVCDGAIVISCGIVNVGMWMKIKEPKWILCWYKPAAMGRSPIGFCNWEPMLLYGKTKGQKGMVDVVKSPIQVMNNTGDHPCPKPIGWGRGFINMLSVEGQTVLDPFLGSGTTAIAAKMEGRNYIGIEISEHYVEIARKRLDSVTQKLI